MENELPTDKTGLKNLALTQKIGVVVSDYENQLADLRADITLELQARDAREAALNARIAELEGSDEPVQKDTAPDTTRS